VGAVWAVCEKKQEEKKKIVTRFGFAWLGNGKSVQKFKHLIVDIFLH
jgi:hypothetical protein